jgi:DNA replication protein
MEARLFETRTVEDLVRIAVAGGGFRLHAGTRQTEDLVRIAVAASTKGARIFLAGLGSRTTEDLVRIAVAGKGSVVFDDS